MTSAAIALVMVVSVAGSMPEQRSKCLRCDYRPHRQRIFMGGATYHGGLLLTGICPESPLAKAGVEEGDILVGLGQFEVTSPSELEWCLEHHRGEVVKFYVVRDGETLFGHIVNPRQRTPWRSRLFGRGW
jgi:membrane-associated protease RseP (regulator of RpoE activity)